MKRPVVYFRSTGATGNVYAILGAVRTELGASRRDLFNKIYGRVMECHSYAEALSIVRESVDLIDLDGKY